MTNAELIKALRVCGDEPYDITKPCKVSPWKLMRASADALEAAEQRIAELEAQMPKEGEWIGIEYDGYADGCPVYDLWECSECGEEHNGEEDTLPNYCPNCGADMRKGEQE